MHGCHSALHCTALTEQCIVAFDLSARHVVHSLGACTCGANSALGKSSTVLGGSGPSTAPASTMLLTSEYLNNE